MTKLGPGWHVSGSGTILKRGFDLRDTGTTPLAGVVPVGPTTGDVDETGLIPNAYLVKSLSDKLSLGLGLGSTFGSVTEYDPAYFGRFSGISIDYKQTNLNPSIAYQATDEVSIGFGFNIAQAEASLVQAVPPLGGIPANATGEIDVDATATGFNLGALFEPRDGLRFGIAYRQAMDFDLEGEQTISAINLRRDVEAQLEAPASLSFSAMGKIAPRTDLLFDFTRTYWSGLQTLTAQVSGTNTNAAAPIRFNFEDSNRIALGVRHQYNDRLSVRAGIAYDHTPVPDAASRTVTLPDSDRLWLALGARIGLSKTSSLDIGFAYLRLAKTNIDRVVTTPDETTALQRIRADVEADAMLLSVQYNIRF